MKTEITKIELPKRYQTKLFPESIELTVPGFKRESGTSLTPVLSKKNSNEWYNELVDKVINSCANKFLPICRFGDGEYILLLGEQPYDFRLSFVQKLRREISRYKEMIILRGGFAPRTIGHYHSGEYSRRELRQAHLEIPKLVREISRKGILALFFNYTNVPFYEKYLPALEYCFEENNICINRDNYCAGYFVYAMLTGPRRGELLKDRRVLVVNGAQGEKKQKIIEGLKREGVSEVFWCPISWKRSLYDVIDVTPFIGKVDLAFVGAGIGKFNIFPQLEPLNVPCIDAGFVFEIWVDPKNKWERPFCASDDDWEELEKIKEIKTVVK